MKLINKLFNYLIKKNLLLILITFLYVCFIFSIFYIPAENTHLFFIDERIICFLIPLLVVVLKKSGGIKEGRFWRYHLILSLILGVIAPFLIALEYFTHHNFVLSFLGVNYSRVFYLSLTTIIVSLISQIKCFYSKYWKVLLFILPLLIVTSLVFIYLRNNQLYRWMIAEDSLIEWVQFVILLMTSFFSLKLSLFWKNKNKFIMTVFISFSLILFFVAGEEISWGQRLLMIETPEQLAERNLQEEITVHNIDTLFGLVYRGYMIIGLLGSSLWVVKRVVYSYLNKSCKLLFDTLVPNWYLFIYFIIAFIYNFNRIYISKSIGESLIEEPMEMILMFGIFLFFLENYLIDKKVAKLNES